MSSGPGRGPHSLRRGPGGARRQAAGRNAARVISAPSGRALRESESLRRGPFRGRALLRLAPSPSALARARSRSGPDSRRGVRRGLFNHSPGDGERPGGVFSSDDPRAAPVPGSRRRPLGQPREPGGEEEEGRVRASWWCGRPLGRLLGGALFHRSPHGNPPNVPQLRAGAGGGFGPRCELRGEIPSESGRGKRGRRSDSRSAAPPAMMEM